MEDKYGLIKKGLIPLDKSWIIRMGFLDILNGYKDIVLFLKDQKNLGEDLQALLRVAKNWDKNKEIDVGESGTVFRYFQFASWKLGLNKSFIKRGTLAKRPISQNLEIVDFSIDKLLKLDNNSSQWASASVLMGNNKSFDGKVPFKLNVTFEALKHWNYRRMNGKSWDLKYDETFLNQANAFIDLLKKSKSSYFPEQSEDYCFARVFGFIDRKYGVDNWPNLQGNETKRLDEVDKQINNYLQGKEIDAPDHRIVQALAMKAVVDEKKIKFKFPESVKKTWPQFWDFMVYVSSLTKK